MVVAGTFEKLVEQLACEENPGEAPLLVGGALCAGVSNPLQWDCQLCSIIW